MFWPSYPLTQAKTTQHRQNKRALRTSYDSIIDQANHYGLILPYNTECNPNHITNYVHNRIVHNNTAIIDYDYITKDLM